MDNKHDEESRPVGSTMEQPRLSILLECFSCIPFRGSEPALGWNFVTELAKRHDLHVLGQIEESREIIEKYLADHPELAAHVKFHYFSYKLHPVLRKIWPPSYYWFLNRWYATTYRYARELVKREHFDLVHHVTLAGYRAPGFLWKLRLPFVWGPVGGLNNTPWCLIPHLGLKGGIFYTMRNLINSCQKHFGFAARIVSRRAACIMTSTEAGAEDVAKFWHRKAEPICEIGVKEELPNVQPVPHEAGTPLRICWVGELTARKALNFLIDAVEQCDRAMDIHVLGDGENRKKWEDYAAKLPSRHTIRFYGNVPLHGVSALMRSSHVLCITSVRDDTSTITIESLQHGLPIIALDHCGYASVINESCGIKVPITRYRDIIARYAQSLDRLATDEPYRLKLCAGARQRVKDYTWKRKMETVDRLYHETLTNRRGV